MGQALPPLNLMRSALATALLVVSGLIPGCTTVEERQAGPGVFEISAPATEFTNSEERARYLIRLRARELCPTGFERERESRIVDSKALETVIWRVMCRGG
jgi:hypothetical protein